MQSLIVKKINKINLETGVAPDKSITHRAVMLSAISKGNVEVVNYLPSLDCMATIKAFVNMGVNIDLSVENTLKINGLGLNGLKQPEVEIDCGNSGTLARILPGVISGQNITAKLVGDASLSSRPLKRIIIPLRKMGVKISAKMDEFLPLEIKGGIVNSIYYEMPVNSAQVKSAIMFAALYSKEKTFIFEKVKSRDHTERIFKHFGINLEIINNKVIIDGTKQPQADKVIIPGDFSSAAFFIVLGLIHPDAKIFIKNVGINPTRIGLLNKLMLMGGKIQIKNIVEFNEEPSADIYVESSNLKGINIIEEDIPSMIDEIPVFALAAAFADGKTSISGARELRVKETDRIKTISQTLKEFGIMLEEKEDGLIIEDSKKTIINDRIHLCNSNGDHRIAMLAAIAGLTIGTETKIDDTECIETSFPDFERILEKCKKN